MVACTRTHIHTHIYTHIFCGRACVCLWHMQVKEAMEVSALGRKLSARRLFMVHSLLPDGSAMIARPNRERRLLLLPFFFFCEKPTCSDCRSLCPFFFYDAIALLNGCDFPLLRWLLPRLSNFSFKEIPLLIFILFF